MYIFIHIYSYLRDCVGWPSDLSSSCSGVEANAFFGFVSSDCISMLRYWPPLRYSPRDSEPMHAG